MLEILSEVFFDVLKTVPLLCIVYALLYLIENKLTNTPTLLSRTMQFGPVVGALAGLIPQCGFSAAASALFSAGYLAPATLVAVYLATSDEALPVLLAGGVDVFHIVMLFVFKFIIAVVGGYLLMLSVFRQKPNFDEPIEIEMDECGCNAGSPVLTVLWRTVKTSLFLFGIMFLLDLVIEWIGPDALSSLLLTDSIFQPLLCAILGLVPSCAMSVLLAELFASGTISFGAMVAGLSTGAGFGYIILLGEKSGRHRAIPIVIATLLIAVVSGTLLQFFFA